MRKNKSSIKNLMSTKGIHGSIDISMSTSPTFGWEVITVEQLSLLAELKFDLFLGAS